MVIDTCQITNKVSPVMFQEIGQKLRSLWPDVLRIQDSYELQQKGTYRIYRIAPPRYKKGYAHVNYELRRDVVKEKE